MKYITIIDPGCERLPVATSITLPLTWFTPTDSIYQLLVDLRHQNTLPNWKSAVVICDIQTGEGTLQAVLDGMANDDNNADITLTVFSVNSLSPYKSL